MQTTFLTEDQIWGGSALDVIKKYGTKTALTDLAIALGGYMGSGSTTSEGDKAGYVWSASAYVSCVRVVLCGGGKCYWDPNSREVAGRPALPSSVTSKIRPNAVRAVSLPEGQVKICQFGEYPQNTVSGKIYNELENAYNHSRLQKTGKTYTFDSAELEDYNKPFSPKRHDEYVLNGRKYVRVEGKRADSDSILSNGQNVRDGQAYWLEVSPIEWLMDKSGVWVAKKALFAGIQFDRKNSYDGNFSRTDMCRYLDNYFSKEMQNAYSPVYDYTAEKTAEDIKAPEPSARQRRYGIRVVEEPLSVKDQIDFYVNNGMSFMLHGPSGVGKTARVEAIDPDLTAVPLWNGVLPEDIVGKVRYPSGETGLPDENRQGGVWVAPDWYNELCKKCEKEPDKKHVLFIDEVTNARPTTQSLIFHITLKKSISPSKGKLPDNAVVVLAGNSKEESGAAYNMPEPLFRRMCGHIYLEADVPEWLEWASEKSRKHPEDPERLNIHPLVSSFVGTYGRDVFYSSYDEENPQQWAMDPRGWEQVSDIIYDNKGIIRRELLESKMGRELAAGLLAYAQNPPLSLEEIINGEYSRQDIPEGHDARLALTMNLRHVDEKNVGKVRSFIAQNLGQENRAVFDSLWIGKNDERALQIAQMQKYTKDGRM